MRSMLVIPFAVAALLAAESDSAFAGGRADTTTAKVSVTGSLNQLGSSTVKLAVKNVGGAAASKPAITLLLSKDRRRGKTDVVVGGARLKKLKARGSSALRLIAVVPSTLKVGRYYLLACAAVKRQKSSRNDCSASRRKLAVKVQTAPIVPQIVTQPAAAASKAVDSGGGSLSVALPGGSTATLKIPAKALASATTVSLVPVASIAPVPSGTKAIASVLIEPEGLIAPGSTITFAPSVKVSAAKLSAFAFGGEDEAIVATPLLFKSGIALNASLFGGYGIGAKSESVRKSRKRAIAGRYVQISASNPCSEESLRKRAESIAAGVDPSNAASISSMFEALDTFVANELDPAIDAAIKDGALPDDVSPLVALELDIERQAELVGEKTGNSEAFANRFADVMHKVTANSITRCETRGQGAVTTGIQVLGMMRQMQLLGVSSNGIEADFDSRCASKPWLLKYDMTIGEQWIYAPAPPILASANGQVEGLQVPAPVLADFQTATASPGQKAMNFSALSCIPGIYASCNVTSASGDLQAKLARTETTSKSETRCGRTVSTPVVLDTFQLAMVGEAQNLHLTSPPSIVFDFPNSGTFDRAFSVSSADESPFFKLPDNGGSTPLAGSSGNFHGSMLSINDSGSLELTLK